MAEISSRNDVRRALARGGITIRSVATELNVNPLIVQQVLSGRLKGERGDAHKVAVALGLKDGVIIANDLPIVEALKMAAAH